MILHKETPRTVGTEGQTNHTYSTVNPADVYPSHPANLLPSIAEHLLMVAFGPSYAAASAEAVKVAQEMALTITVIRGVASRKPAPAWRAARLTCAEGAMLAAYARLSGDTAVIVGAPVNAVCECRELSFTPSDTALVSQPDTPLPHTVEFNELALRLHLDEFAKHARRHGYSEARIVELAGAVTPLFPLKSWREVAAGLGLEVNA